MSATSNNDQARDRCAFWLLQLGIVVVSALAMLGCFWCLTSFFPLDAP